MSQSTVAPQQYKQPSRKGKKAWRKNVDISQVQAGLENLREEIIQGGPIAEKASEELFTLDTTGSEAIRTAYKIHKPLKADQILAQRSAVPVVDGRKRTTELRTTDGILEPSSKRHKSNWVSRKEVQRLKQVAAKNGADLLSAEKLDQQNERTAFDLWALSEPVQEVVSEYIPQKKPKVAPPTIREAPITMTASGKSIPAVQNPKAGTSYNPSFEDWDELLTEEGQKAVNAEKERLQVELKASELQKRIDAAKEQASAHDDDESAWEGIESEYEGAELKQKRPERKTPSQRNKATRRKEAERKALHVKKMADQKKMAAQIAALENRKRILLGTTNESESSESEVDDQALRRRKFGNVPIPVKPLEVVLPDELQESLRRLRPEGNLLNDRFRNLLVQGKLESRKPVRHSKKKRVKMTEKWTYKDVLGKMGITA